MEPHSVIPLPRPFYANPDVAEVSRKLLGATLCSTAGNHYTAGMITETEAYCGRNDKACHANNGKRTSRTEVMFGEPGHAYIYLCYGIHHLLNVVTNLSGRADAVLIRAIRPTAGIDIMMKRRNQEKRKDLTNGPGKLTQALGITTSLNSHNLCKPPIWIEPPVQEVHSENIKKSPRIGVDYAGDDANRLWRFYI
jgi:DNA-3-methyladenine glycosylase